MPVSSPVISSGPGSKDLGDLARPAPGEKYSTSKASPDVPARQPQSGPYALFNLSPLRLDFPQDFELGAIQAEYPRDEEERAAAQPAYAFLVGLKNGKLDDSCVLPDKLAQLNRELYPFFREKKAIVDFRLGFLRREGDEAQGHAALYSKEGTAIAEIYLVKAPSGWKVESFSADFDSLDTPRPAEEERFEPGEYKVFTPF